jgi:hypothetical protein
MWRLPFASKQKLFQDLPIRPMARPRANFRDRFRQRLSTAKNRLGHSQSGGIEAQ